MYALDKSAKKVEKPLILIILCYIIIRLENIKEVNFLSTVKMSKQLSTNLFLLFTINVFGKIAFSAVTVELVATEVMTKTEAGLINALFWLLYGIGQCFGGYVAERVKPYLLMKLTFFLSFVLNALIFVFDAFIPILVFWTLNGLCQFGLWPAILKVVSTDIVFEVRDKARSKLAYSYALGSILSYLLTSIILLVLPWQYMFLICAVVNLLSVVAVVIIERKYSKVVLPQGENVKCPVDSKENGKINAPVLMSGGIILFCSLIFIRNIVENCIKTWMPTILTEVYDANTSYTLMLSVVMMFVSVVGVFLGLFIYKKMHRDEGKSLAFMGLLALPFMLLTLLYQSTPMLLTTLYMIITAMLFYAAGQLLLNYYPAYFYKWGLSAFVGGIINAFAAFGNVVSSYGGGYVADNYSWDTLILLWNVFLVIFIILSLVGIIVLKRFKKRYK